MVWGGIWTSGFETERDFEEEEEEVGGPALLPLPGRFLPRLPAFEDLWAWLVVPWVAPAEDGGAG